MTGVQTCALPISKVDTPAAAVGATAAKIGDGAAPLVSLEDAQRAAIREAFARSGGRLYGPGGAAALLGMKPTTLQSRMKKLGIVKEG